MSLLVAVVLSLFLSSADDLTLSVNVLDASGKAVPQAVLLLENTTDQKRLEGTTTESGAYHFDRLPIGSYVLRVAKEGFFINEVEIRLEASKVVDFTLVPM